MDDSFYVIMFFLITLGLFVAEVFIPSGGIIGFLAVISLAISAWYAWNSWAETSPVIWWSYVLAVLLLIPTTIGGAFYIMPRTAFGKKLMPEPPTLAEVTGYAKEEKRLNELVGSIGKTVALLTPGGLVDIDGERFHCESEGVIVEGQTPVEIIQVKGNRLVVRPVRKSASTDGATGNVTATQTADDNSPALADNSADANTGDEKLDFDVPPG